jgi:hypothetical protein
MNTTTASDNVLAVEFVKYKPVSHELIPTEAITSDVRNKYRLFCERCFEEVHYIKGNDGDISYPHRKPKVHCKWFDGDCESILNPRFPDMYFDFNLPEVQNTESLFAAIRQLGAANEANKANERNLIVTNKIGDLVECYRAYDNCRQAQISVPFSYAATYGELFRDLRDRSVEIGRDSRIYFGRMDDPVINGDHLEFRIQRSSSDIDYVRVFIRLDESQIDEAQRKWDRRARIAHIAYVLGQYNEKYHGILATSATSFCSIER